jgi:hypothetical protein
MNFVLSESFPSGKQLSPRWTGGRCGCGGGSPLDQFQRLPQSAAHGELLSDTLHSLLNLPRLCRNPLNGKDRRSSAAIGIADIQLGLAALLNQPVGRTNGAAQLSP